MAGRACRAQSTALGGVGDRLVRRGWLHVGRVAVPGGGVAQAGVPMPRWVHRVEDIAIAAGAEGVGGLDWG